MALNRYFDEAKRRLDIKTDSMLAKHLGMIPQELSRARKQGWCSDDVLRDLHQILGASMEELALAREASKAGPMQPVWMKAYRTVKRAGAITMISAVMISGLGPNDVRANVVQREMQECLLPEILFY